MEKGVFSMGEVAVRVENFTMQYGSVVAVDNISFSVRRGEVFGLLGPNGAGKTSTLECLEGLRTPTSGKLAVMGLDPVRQRTDLLQLTGVQLQVAGLPDSITPKEAMEIFSAYHRVAPRFDLLERLGLSAEEEKQYHALSTGQQRRLALALAVNHQPQVLFLDEPTAGLDVSSRSELHKLISEFKEQGATILLSTHDMTEAEALSDQVAILLRGKLVAQGSPRHITATGAGLTRVSVRTEKNSLVGHNFPAVFRTIEKDGYCVHFSSDTAATVGKILDMLTDHKDSLIDLRVERPSLEERFLELTQEVDVS